MKRNLPSCFWVAVLMCAVHMLQAQITPGLSIETYAGLSVTGEVKCEFVLINIGENIVEICDIVASRFSVFD